LGRKRLQEETVWGGNVCLPPAHGHNRDNLLPPPPVNYYQRTLGLSLSEKTKGPARFCGNRLLE